MTDKNQVFMRLVLTILNTKQYLKFQDLFDLRLH